MIETIVKRDGTHEPFDSTKLFKWAEWACKGVAKYVDWGKVVLTAVNDLPKVCKSSMLQEALIDACKDMNTWSYYKMAGRLYASQLDKKIFPEGKPTVLALHAEMAKIGYMEKLDYTEAEYAEIENLINHDLDNESVWFGLAYINGKYALKNKINNKVYETQQFVYMRMAMALGQGELNKMEVVKDYYELFNEKVLNAPTPNYVNLGTPLRGYASCCVYTTKDTADSLAVGDHIAYKMTCLSAGIGNNLQTRSVGDPVRGGAIKHRGKIFYYKAVVAATQANMQNGRGGAATTHSSVYDPEVMDILQLRNPRQTEDKRVRGMHFSLQTNKPFARIVAEDGNYSTFSMYSQPELHKAFYSSDEAKFLELYNTYLTTEEAKNNTVRARDAIVTSLTEAFETGTAYLSWIDEMNRHTSFKDPIFSSNLCVAPETKILTKEGYEPIVDLVGQSIDIWNGEEWSLVDVVKTGENQKLIKVITSAGQSLECTEYHKWYVVTDYHKDAIVKTTKELNIGDKLIKFDLPVIEGKNELNLAYDNGFYTGDGCFMDNASHIYLYHDKRKLANIFKSVINWRPQPIYKRLIGRAKGLRDKYFVPDSSYTIKCRLEWLAGLLDSDGCVYRNGTNEALNLSSVRYDFLLEVQTMLQTLGVGCKISKMADEEWRSLPANDGSGKLKEFMCKAAYRLLITSVDSQKLISLGLVTHRLKIDVREPQRDAKQFNKIAAIIDEERYDDTYCFTEHKRNMGMFNGILTGQCLETGFSSKGYDNMAQLYSDKFVFSEDGLGEQEPEIGLCSLAAINVAKVRDDAHYAKATYYALKMVDKCIHLTNYPFPHLELTAKARMNAGIGMVGLAHLMAKECESYTTESGKAFIHKLAETHAWHVINASLRLGKELGNAKWMSRTKWPDGWLPIDTYCKAVDKITPNVLTRDWEGLRAEIVANKGIRNSCLINYMPSESSSKASETTNSIYPVRDLSLIKTDDTTKIYWAAPDSDKYKYSYEMAWDIPTKDMIDCYAIVQKWTDQSISADLYRKVIDDEVVYTSELISDYLYMTEVGMKSRYYQNSKTSSGELQIEEACGDGGCKL